mgnify:CR=1 FL=1
MNIVFFLILIIAFLYYKSSNESFQNVECEQPQTCPECPKCPECPYMGVPEQCPECPRCPEINADEICKNKNWSYPQWTFLDPKEIYKGHQKPPVCAMDKDIEGNVIIREQPDAVLAKSKFTNYLEAHQNTNVGDYLPKKKLIRDADFYNKYDKCYNEKVEEHINNEHINDKIKHNYTQKWQPQQKEEYKNLQPQR